jgi:polyketide biosynthesis enoyl-CoA hydratase PksI
MGLGGEGKSCKVLLLPIGDIRHPKMANVFVTHLEEGIFQLQMDAPETNNQLNAELIQALMSALTTLSTDSTLKVLIFKGRKDIFCAGGTLEMLKGLSSGQTSVKDLLQPLVGQIFGFPVPIIGALEGHALGGGLMLALFCDILVAAENSRYGANFTSLGFTPGMGATSLLPALVGHHFASEMLFSAKLYKGRELKGRGLFNHVVPADDVMDVALDIALRIAEKPHHVLKMLKEALSQPRRQALQEALFREHLMHDICFANPETIALIEATYSH